MVRGDKAWMDMDSMRLHDPFSVIRYGAQNKLTTHPQWDWVESFIDNDELCTEMINAYRVSLKPPYKFGHQVPQSAEEAYQIDDRTKTKEWDKALKAEIGQMNDYEVFRVLENWEKIPEGYKKIPYNLVFDMKFDGRRKA